jgi:hypothetical protein
VALAYRMEYDYIKTHMKASITFYEIISISEIYSSGRTLAGSLRFFPSNFLDIGENMLSVGDWTTMCFDAWRLLLTAGV